jgi:hypothetical protein
MQLTEEEKMLLVEDHKCGTCLPDLAMFKYIKEQGAKEVKQAVQAVIKIIEDSWNKEDGEYTMGCKFIVKLLEEVKDL